MKVLLLCAAIVVAVTANISDHEHWANFKAKHNKHYELVEEKFRFEIFQKNLRKIEEHNERYEKGEVTYFLKQTQFTDMTTEEIKSMLNYRPANIASYEKLSLDKDYVRPDSVDWREKNAVGPVKNQKLCGGCWAFSTTGSLEGQLRIHKNDEVSLSEQELIDCDTNQKGCGGGNVGFAFIYVKKHGLSSEEQYPYIYTESGQCKAGDNKPLKNLSGFAYLNKNEENLADGVATVGPISIGIAAEGDFSFYGGGVYSGHCGQNITHAVLAVGYAPDYWIVKNSWGAEWGENGFIKMKRGVGLCLLGEDQSYPKL